MSSSSEAVTRITAAIARNVGIRWCSTCQMARPAEGFVKRGSRLRCAACDARAKQFMKGRK